MSTEYVINKVWWISPLICKSYGTFHENWPNPQVPCQIRSSKKALKRKPHRSKDCLQMGRGKPLSHPSFFFLCPSTSLTVYPFLSFFNLLLFLSLVPEGWLRKVEPRVRVLSVRSNTHTHILSLYLPMYGLSGGLKSRLD